MVARNLEIADGRDCAVAKTGSCSWKLTGNGAEKRIMYHYRPDGSAGDTFDLSIWRKGLSTTGAGYAVIDIFVIHQDLSNDHIVFNLQSGDMSQWEQKQISFSATEDYQLIVVSVVYKKPGGTFWVDDFSLVRNSSTELMQTGSFETVMPATWMTARNMQVADGRDCAVAKTGSCSWKLTGNGVEKRIMYHYRPDGLAGDSFDLRIWRTGVNTSGAGYVVLDIFVIHQDLSTDHIVFNIQSGDMSQWEEFLINFTASEDYQLIVVSVVYKKSGGTLWIDDISLILRD